MASEATCNKAEDCVSDGEEEEAGVSMLDVLEEEAQLEDDANAVLGGSDPKNCTYLLGYVDRQAVYSCSTCIENTTEPAVICLACSYECHEGHELHELYTKRNLCCDCGNSKFKQKCKLCPTKRPMNAENKYNQNFQGLYCVCHRPYPDPDDKVEDEMIQCIICEDWFHGRHLGTPVPQDYSEMTCGNCLKECNFLRAYHVQPTEIVKLQKEEIETEVTVCDTECKSSTTQRGLDNETQDHSKHQQSHDVKPCEVLCENKDGPDEMICQLKQMVTSNRNEEQTGAIFWQQSWREKLCKCQQCTLMYIDKKVAFLTNPADSVTMYEERGKALTSQESQYDRGLQQLSKMDRTQQIEMMHGYNDMKKELSEYLKKFAENKKVVREEDIREFFSAMSSRKKARVNAPPQNCR